MTVYEYTKSGDIINKNTKIKPTQEMQEVLDTFWNTVNATSIPYDNNFLVENSA